jgi:hypothetical protein
MRNQRLSPAGKKQPLAVAASPGGRLLRESSRGRHLIPALVGNQRAEGGAGEMPAQPEGDYIMRPSRPVKRHLLPGSESRVNGGIRFAAAGPGSLNLWDYRFWQYFCNGTWQMRPLGKRRATLPPIRAAETRHIIPHKINERDSLAKSYLAYL